MDDNMPWVGLGNPCTPDDHDLFAAATKVTTRNGEKASFGNHLGLMGCAQRTSKDFRNCKKEKVHGQKSH
jgi:hypothetical protein